MISKALYSLTVNGLKHCLPREKLACWGPCLWKNKDQVGTGEWTTHLGRLKRVEERKDWDSQATEKGLVQKEECTNSRKISGLREIYSNSLGTLATWAPGLQVSLCGLHWCLSPCKQVRGSYTGSCGPAGFLGLGKPGFILSLQSSETKMQNCCSPWNIVKAEHHNAGSPGPDAELCGQRHDFWAGWTRMSESISTASQTGSKNKSSWWPCRTSRAHSLQTPFTGTCSNDRVFYPGPVRPQSIRLVSSEEEGGR